MAHSWWNDPDLFAEVKRRYDAVPDSAELQRILALPIKDEIDVEQLCDALTAQLKKANKVKP